MIFLGEIVQKSHKSLNCVKWKIDWRTREARYSETSHRWLTYHDHHFNSFDDLWRLPHCFAPFHYSFIQSNQFIRKLIKMWVKCFDFRARIFSSSYYSLSLLHKDPLKIMKHCSSSWTFSSIKYFNMNAVWKASRMNGASNNNGAAPGWKKE